MSRLLKFSTTAIFIAAFLFLFSEAQHEKRLPSSSLEAKVDRASFQRIPAKIESVKNEKSEQHRLDKKRH